MLSIQKGRYDTGFQLTFANGLTISIQFGGGNSCSNRQTGLTNPNINECPNAEVAIWNESDQWFEFVDGRIVNGWVSADDVAKWIYAVQSATSLDNIQVPS